MSKNIGSLIRSAADMPNPTRKDKFIRTYSKQTERKDKFHLKIVLTQCSYIRLPVWFVSTLVLLAALTVAGINENVLLLTSSLIPFVSGIAVWETFRSQIYGMSELEGATFFSVRGVIFTRMLGIGVVNVFLLIALSFICSINGEFGLIRSGVSLLIPYLITSIAGIEFERTSIGRKNVLGCLGISAVVSVLTLVFAENNFILPESYNALRYVFTVLLIAFECVEIIKTYRWEKLSWN